MTRRRRKSRVPEGTFNVMITDLTHDGRGVARKEGKTVFVHGALPDEEVECAYVRIRKDYDEARTVRVITASPDRVMPVCPVFGVCGGCSLQHLSPEKQIHFKARQLHSNLAKQAGIVLTHELPPLKSRSTHYRYKARLGVKYVIKKERVLVGFREKFSPFLVEMDDCPILVQTVENLLSPLALLISRLSIYAQIPQIEVAASNYETALNFRVLSELTESDRDTLIAFSEQHNLLIYIQPGNEASTYALTDNAKAEDALSYSLLDQLSLAFKPYHFTQINPDINQLMVRQVLDLLALKSDECVLDLFCGLGNFTLALGLNAKQVIGVEGDQSLVEWAQKNAARNQLTNVEFYCADLTKNQNDAAWMQNNYDAILIDPPRSGALEMMPYLGRLAAKRIVYVSCHPATLARDIAQLVQYGYKLEVAGVMDMFPHTIHVESMALLTRN